MNGRVVTLLATGAIVIVAVALRVPLIGATDLWLDEAATAIDTQIPLSEVPSLLPRDGQPPQRYVAGHPPLYYLVVSAAAGPFGPSGVVTRAVSTALALLLVLLVIFYSPPSLASWKRARFGCALVIAVHPLALYYGVEAKMYGMQWLLTACVIAALTRATMTTTEPGTQSTQGSTQSSTQSSIQTRALLIAGVAQAALLYTHNFGVLLAPCWFVALWQTRSPATRPLMLRVFLTGLASVLAWLPWAIVALPAQLNVQSQGVNFKRSMLADVGHGERLVDSALALSGVPPFPEWLRNLAWVDGRPITLLSIALLILAIAGAIVGLRAPDANLRKATALLIAGAASTWIGLWLLDFASPLFFPGRYETPALVPLIWLASVPMVAKPRDAWMVLALQGAAIAGIVGLAVGGVSFTLQPESHRFRDTVHALQRAGATGDDVVVAGFAWGPLQVAAWDAFPRRADGSAVELAAFPAALATSAGEATTLKAGVDLEREAKAFAATAAGRRRTFLVGLLTDRQFAVPLVEAFLARGCEIEQTFDVHGHQAVVFDCSQAAPPPRESP